MSITDALRRSLGFEETESGERKDEIGNITDSISNTVSDLFNSLRKPSNNGSKQQNSTQSQHNPTQNHRQRQYNPSQRPTQSPMYHPRPTSIYDDDYVITPERSFYEIVLIRPKTIDDINYIVDQVVDEKNPVIVDLSFLENESEANFRLAGEKIKHIRSRHDVQAVLLARSEEKNLILLSPKKVSVINKG